MRKKILAVLMCIVISTFIIPSTSMAKACKPVKMIGKDTHYEVVLDYTTGLSHYQMGAEYGKEIIESVPEYEALCDSYIAEVTGNEAVYNEFLSRVEDIKPQIKQEYIDEIEGLASGFSGGTENVIGDNKLSVDECFILIYSRILPEELSAQHFLCMENVQKLIKPCLLEFLIGMLVHKTKSLSFKLFLL